MNMIFLKKTLRYLLLFLLLSFSAGTIINIAVLHIGRKSYLLFPLYSLLAVALTLPFIIKMYTLVPSMLFIYIPCLLFCVLICLVLFRSLWAVWRNLDSSATFFLIIILFLEGIVILFATQLSGMLYVAIDLIFIALLIAYRKDYLETDDE